MDFASIAERIQAGDQAAEAELVGYLERRVKYIVLRQVRSDDYADITNDVVMIVLRDIRSGAIRDPNRIPGYVRTVVQREIAAWVKNRVRDRAVEGGEEEASRVLDVRLTPEQDLLLQERRDIMRRAIAELSPRDREILTRFYLDEQTPDQICREMGLNETQFRLVKNRAKNKFGDIGKRIISDKEQILMRLAAKCHRDKLAA